MGEPCIKPGKGPSQRKRIAKYKGGRIHRKVQIKFPGGCQRVSVKGRNVKRFLDLKAGLLPLKGKDTPPTPT